MLFVSAYDIFVSPIREIIITLQTILGIGSIAIGLIAVIPSFRSERKSSKNYLLGLSLFFILFGIYRLILVWHDFYLPDELDQITFIIAVSFFLIGIIILVFTIETYVYKKTRHIFTIIGIILSIVYLIIPNREIAQIVLYITSIALLLPAFIIYIFLAKNSSGSVRKNSIIILIGMSILTFFQLTGIYERLGLMDIIFASIIAPPSSLIGLVILGYGLIAMSR